jgi:hypothetical protein
MACGPFRFVERELTPQQAAAVWTQVPVVESALTSKVAGISNILTGLAFVFASLPALAGWVASRNVGVAVWGDLTTLWVLVGTLGLFAVFLLLRTALWRVYALARPDTALGSSYDKGMGRVGYRWWFIAVVAWTIALAFVGEVVHVPGFVKATAGFGLLFSVYLLTMGHWESKQSWSRRPYLLVAAVLAFTAWLVFVAFGPKWAFADFGILGLGWIAGGLLLYHQV